MNLLHLTQLDKQSVWNILRECVRLLNCHPLLRLKSTNQSSKASLKLILSLEEHIFFRTVKLQFVIESDELKKCDYEHHLPRFVKDLLDNIEEKIGLEKTDKGI